MRTLGMVITAVLGGLMFSSLLGAQPETLTLMSPALQTRERPPVSFPHGRHMEGDLSCKDCHHRTNRGRMFWMKAISNPEGPGSGARSATAPGAGGACKRSFTASASVAIKKWRRRAERMSPATAGSVMSKSKPYRPSPSRVSFMCTLCTWVPGWAIHPERFGGASFDS